MGQNPVAPVVVYYHSADFDGYCSAAIVQLHNMGVGLEFIPVNYGWNIQLPDALRRRKKIFILDFSFEEEFLAKLVDAVGASNVVWIDHHQTAIDQAAGTFAETLPGIRNTQKAGCELTWEYLFEPPVPRAVWLLGRYDVWDHRDPQTLPFQKGMWGHVEEYRDPRSVAWKDLIFHQDMEVIAGILKDGDLLLKAQKGEFTAYAKNHAFEAQFTAPDGCSYRAICINRGSVPSDIFEAVFDRARHDLMVSFAIDRDAVVKVSLRSEDGSGIQCHKIAEQFVHGGKAGGGHPGAAGFRVADLSFLVPTGKTAAPVFQKSA